MWYDLRDVRIGDLGKVLLVDTSATVNGSRDNRGSRTFNFGMDIVCRKLGADVCSWLDRVDITGYDVVAFNVYYSMNLLNIRPFLELNGINRGDIRLIAGGQGINCNGILDSLVDDVYYGEIDYDENEESIVSDAVIVDGRGIVEVQRGCRYSCKFCNYGNDRGGNYREKGIDLLKEQLDYLCNKGVYQVTFLSVNLAGYSKLDELFEYCIKMGIKIRNADTTVFDFRKMGKYMDYLPRSFRFGVESFDYGTRCRLGKGFTDEMLYDMMGFMMGRSVHLHLYLMYGLPDDDYSSWFRATGDIVKLVDRETKYVSNRQKNLLGSSCEKILNNVRIDYSISVFEPEENTPYSDMPYPDFREKHLFMDEFFKYMVDIGFIKTGGRDDLDYTKMHGRFGKGEYYYKFLMKLKRGDISDGEFIFSNVKSGFRGAVPIVKSMHDWLDIKFDRRF